jgi:hypothetical protein
VAARGPASRFPITSPYRESLEPSSVDESIVVREMRDVEMWSWREIGAEFGIASSTSTSLTPGFTCDAAKTRRVFGTPA